MAKPPEVYFLSSSKRDTPSATFREEEPYYKLTERFFYTPDLLPPVDNFKSNGSVYDLSQRVKLIDRIVIVIDRRAYKIGGVTTEVALVSRRMDKLITMRASVNDILGFDLGDLPPQSLTTEAGLVSRYQLTRGRWTDILGQI